MSKTKGNVVDPLDVTATSGSDSLRLTLLALSGQGRNVNLDLKRLEGYKAFINKLWVEMVLAGAAQANEKFERAKVERQ